MGILISEGQGTTPPTILKSPEIDPALVKAAEAQKSAAGVPDSTAAGVDIAGATRISQSYGGSAGDYVGLNHYQLADKLGGNPSDYTSFLPGAEPVKAVTQSVVGDSGGGGSIAPPPATTPGTNIGSPAVPKVGDSNYFSSGQYDKDIAAARAAAAARDAENNKRIQAAIDAGDSTYDRVLYDPKSTNPLESAGGLKETTPQPSTTLSIDPGLAKAAQEQQKAALEKINELSGVDKLSQVDPGLRRAAGEPTYDVVSLLQSGKVTESEIAAVFGGEVAKNARAQVDALNVLEKYKTPDGGYSLIAAKYDGVSNDTLAQVGFSKPEIDEAAKFTEHTPSWGEWLTYYKPTAGNEKNAAYNEYVKRYGLANWIKSAYQSAGESMFPPARALRDDVTVGDITPLEWGMGAAQVALFALPALSLPAKAAAAAGASEKVVAGLYTAGQGVSRTVQAGIGGMMTYDTVKNWGNMSEVEKVVSVAFDTLILGSALSGLRSPFRKGGSWHVNTAAKASIKTFAGEKTANAAGEVEAAIKAGSPSQLEAAAKKLELAARAEPNQLGTDAIIKKAQLIKANPNDYINLAKEKPLNPKIDEGLRANRQFIKSAEDALKRVQDPTRRAAVEEALKQARKQVKIAEKTRIDPGWEIDFNSKPMKGPIEKSTKEIVVREEKGGVPAKRKTTETRIAVREFARKSLPEIAKEHKVSVDAVRWAVSASPKATQQEIVYAIAKFLVDNRPVTAIFTQPATRIKPQTETRPETAPVADTKTQPATDTKVQTAPKTDVKTETETQTKTPVPLKQKTKTKKQQRLHSSNSQSTDEKVVAQAGDVIWQQGAFYVTKRGNEELWTKYPPEGMDKRGTPDQTVKVRGKPGRSKMSMGVVSVNIDPANSDVLDFDEAKPPKLNQSMPRSVRRQLGMR